MDSELHFIGEKIPSRKVSDLCSAVKIIMTELGLGLRSVWLPHLPSFYNTPWPHRPSTSQGTNEIEGMHFFSTSVFIAGRTIAL